MSNGVPMVVAINQALDHALENDHDVFLLGEDISDPAGGSFGATKGLSTKFGRERVRETPISEQAIVGAAIGAAILGAKPVAEIMFNDFLGVCLDQVANHAAKLRYMSGGRTTVPLVIRCVVTGGLGVAAQHSQSLEAWLTHVPGLRVATPATPADAKGLLLAAIDDPDPVVILEPVQLYGATGPVPDGDYKVPLGKAHVAREGKDVTVVTYGSQVPVALGVADQLSDEGVDVEVIDLRWLAPWDEEAVLDSVRNTERAVVLHQAVRRCGFGAEVAAVLQEKLWETLAAPVLRVAAADTPVPSAAGLEAVHMPSAEQLVDAIRAVNK